MRVRMPGDIEQPDRLLLGLTAKQLALLAAAAVLIWGTSRLTPDPLPLPAFAVAAAVFGALSVAVVLGRRDGIALEKWLRHAATHLRQAKRLVPAPGGELPGLPAWAPPAPRVDLAPLRLPARAIEAAGVIDLGTGGCAVLVACTTTNLALASAEEQAAMVGGWAATVNSLTGPVQILIRAERLDLGPLAAAIDAAAPGLPHPALEQAARGHAAFLRGLQASRDLLHRQICLALRSTEPANQAGRLLLGQAHDLAAQLAGAGVEATVLDGDHAAAVLAACLNPTTDDPEEGDPQ